jgi:hypothetical protein
VTDGILGITGALTFGAANSQPSATPVMGASTGGGLFSTPLGGTLTPVSAPAPALNLGAASGLTGWNTNAAAAGTSLPRNNSMRKGKTRK